MRVITLGAVLAILTLGLVGRGQPPVPPLPGEKREPQPTPAVAPPAVGVPPEIKALVARLGADDYRAREKAGRDIAALGDKALPVLVAALRDVDDPEAARRLEVIVEKLENARLVNPRRITASFKNSPGKAAFDELAKLSGYRLQTAGVGDTAKVTLDLTDAPFWEALDKLCDAAGVSANLQDEDGTLAVYGGDAVNPYVAYSGPFKIVATNINSNKGLQLSGLSRQNPVPRQPENLYLNLQIMSEPKAAMIGIGQAVVVKATDDTGASLLPPPQPVDPNNPPPSFYPPQIGYKSFNQNTAVNLFRTARAATAIKEMKVKVAVTLLAQARPDVAFENILKAKGKRLTGRAADVTIRDVSEANGMTLVGLTATNARGNPDDYAWTNSVHQRLELYDDRGQKFRSFGLTEQNVGPNVVTLGAQFGADPDRKMGKPARLVVVDWVPLTREIEFTLKDVPLP